ncbi:MAG: putative Ig domain-containing protein [Cyanobacteria bacterium P01_E01_bin.42]
MMKKKLVTVLLVLLLGCLSMLVTPVSVRADDSLCKPGTGIPVPGAFRAIRIGDADGFGFGDGSGLTAAYGGPANEDGKNILTTGDFVPDLNGDGKISNRDKGDPFGNRSDAEIAGNFTTGIGFTDAGSKGSEYTDLSLARSFAYETSSTFGKPFPGGKPKKLPYKPTFEFNFTVEKDKLPTDTPLFLNVMVGDYDVQPAEVILTSTDGTTETQELTASPKGKKDGRIQAAFIPLEFSQVFTDKGSFWQGSLKVEFNAPKEPYLAFDFVEIGTNQIPLVPCATNQPPEVDESIPEQTVTPCNGFSFTIPDKAFSDADGDPLAYTATLESGGPLPSWLQFNGATGLFSGVPGDGDEGTLSIKVTAADGVSGEASTTFALKVQPFAGFVVPSGGSVAGTCTIPPDTSKTVTVPVKITTPESAGALPLDVMLTQDLTGSYRDDLPVLKSVVPSLISSLQNKQPDTTFGVATFMDKPFSPLGQPSDYVYRTDLALTPNAAQFQATVNAFPLGNGNDTPEASLEALLQVAVRAESELGFRKGSRRTAIVSTDAPYHQAGDYARLRGGVPANNGNAVLDGNGLGEDYPAVPQVKAALENANIVPIFLVTNDQLPTYQNLVGQLGVGTVVGLSADSSNLVGAIEQGLENVNRDFTIVVVDDSFGYVLSIDPNQFKGVLPGTELTVNVKLRYSGRGSGDTIIIRALGTGDLVLDTKVGVSF